MTDKTKAPDERTKIVGYLRSEAVEYEGLFVGTAADVIDKLAAAIERGDHLKASPDTEFSPFANANIGHNHPDYVWPKKGADWKASGGCPCRDCRGGRGDMPGMTRY